MKKIISKKVVLLPEENKRLISLCGELDENLRPIETQVSVSINRRGNEFVLQGNEKHVQVAEKVLQALYVLAEDKVLTREDLHFVLREMLHEPSNNHKEIRTSLTTIKAKNKNQANYLQSMQDYDLNFAVGPAGTGKTFLAVACAAIALEEEQVGRIVLVRPAVEAGESLGYLPGDFSQKIEPYLRPLYDALYEIMGFKWVNKQIDRQIIEVAPLAYMRGRTLNESFIILDEAQNTTMEQMKMFLTRLGFGSTAVVTGDLTQVDLKKGDLSGLTHALAVLKSVKEISFTQFNSKDAVRHHLVQNIIEAYEQHEQ
jgi:phosphate starvation-inducible PhoH-like protein